MKKIETLFVRDPSNPKLVTREVRPDCAWVLAGEGRATRKFDGTCCAIIGGKLYKRIDWDAQKGPAPAEWIHHTRNPEQRSGHGWLPIGIGPEDAWHREAMEPGLPDGTYELCGPRVQRNPENMAAHTLIPHGIQEVDAPRDYDGLREWLLAHSFEGIVWHHPDGRMAKLKRRDFR